MCTCTHTHTHLVDQVVPLAPPSHNQVDQEVQAVQVHSHIPYARNMEDCAFQCVQRLHREKEMKAHI